METELERMVVRLVGDGSDYQKMLQTAQTSTTQAAQQIEAASKRIEGFSAGLQGFAAAATSALAAIGLGGGLKQMFFAFAEAETISIRLNAVLQANGRNVEEVRGKYNAFASEVQRLTVLDDDATLALLNQAESFELTGQAAQNAVKNAVSLAAITGGSAESMIRLTAALAKGDVERAMQMARMVPQLRGITDQSEFVAKATQLMATGWATAQAEAGSASGQLKQLSNAFGNLLEDLGEIVAKAIKPLVTWVQKLVAWFQQLGPEVKTLIVGFVGLLGAITAIGPTVYIFSALIGPIASVGSVVVSLLNPLKLLSLGFGAVTTALGLVRAAATVAFGPIGIAVAAVSAIIAVFISEMGGISGAWTAIKDFAVSAWETIKAKIAEFVEWARPITEALSALFTAVWDVVVEGVKWLWDAVKVVFTAIQDFVSSVWIAISGDATANWDGIRETIVTVVDFCTFTLRNFGQVAEYVWTTIKLSAVTAFDFIRDAAVVVAATLVGIVRAIGNTFGALWTNMVAGAERAINFIRAGWEGLRAAAEAVVNLRNPMRAFREAQQRELARLNAESRQFVNVGEAAAAGFNDGFDATVDALGGVGQSQVQQQLRREYEEQGRALGQSFEEFQRQRRAASDAARDVTRAVEETRPPDDPVAPIVASTKQAVKEVEKFDAALRHSAEGAARITAYLERIGAPRTAPTTPAEGLRGSPPRGPTTHARQQAPSTVASPPPRPTPASPSFATPTSTPTNVPTVISPTVVTPNYAPFIEQVRVVTASVSTLIERLSQLPATQTITLVPSTEAFYAAIEEARERLDTLALPRTLILTINTTEIEPIQQRLNSLSLPMLRLEINSDTIGSVQAQLDSLTIYALSLEIDTAEITQTQIQLDAVALPTLALSIDSSEEIGNVTAMLASLSLPSDLTLLIDSASISRVQQQLDSLHLPVLTVPSLSVPPLLVPPLTLPPFTLPPLPSLSSVSSLFTSVVNQAQGQLESLVLPPLPTPAIPSPVIATPQIPSMPTLPPLTVEVNTAIFTTALSSMRQQLESLTPLTRLTARIDTSTFESTIANSRTQLEVLGTLSAVVSLSLDNAQFTATFTETQRRLAEGLRATLGVPSLELEIGTTVVDSAQIQRQLDSLQLPSLVLNISTINVERTQLQLDALHLPALDAPVLQLSLDISPFTTAMIQAQQSLNGLAVPTLSLTVDTSTISQAQRQLDSLRLPVLTIPPLVVPPLTIPPLPPIPPLPSLSSMASIAAPQLPDMPTLPSLIVEVNTTSFMVAVGDVRRQLESLIPLTSLNIGINAPDLTAIASSTRRQLEILGSMLSIPLSLNDAQFTVTFAETQRRLNTLEVPTLSLNIGATNIGEVQLQLDALHLPVLEMLPIVEPRLEVAPLTLPESVPSLRLELDISLFATAIVQAQRSLDSLQVPTLSLAIGNTDIVSQAQRQLDMLHLPLLEMAPFVVPRLEIPPPPPTLEVPLLRLEIDTSSFTATITQAQRSLDGLRAPTLSLDLTTPRLELDISLFTTAVVQVQQSLDGLRVPTLSLTIDTAIVSQAQQSLDSLRMPSILLLTIDMNVIPQVQQGLDSLRAPSLSLAIGNMDIVSQVQRQLDTLHLPSMNLPTIDVPLVAMPPIPTPAIPVMPPIPLTFSLDGLSATIANAQEQLSSLTVPPLSLDATSIALTITTNLLKDSVEQVQRQLESLEAPSIVLSVDSTALDNAVATLVSMERRLTLLPRVTLTPPLVPPPIPPPLTPPRNVPHVERDVELERRQEEPPARLERPSPVEEQAVEVEHIMRGERREDRQQDTRQRVGVQQADIDTSSRVEVDTSHIVELLKVERVQNASMINLLVSVRDHLRTLTERPRTEIEEF